MDEATENNWDFHLHNILLNGVSVPGQSPYYSDLRDSDKKRYRRFNFLFAGYRHDTIYRFPGDTQYSMEKSVLKYNDLPLNDIPFKKLKGAKDQWGSETGWWFKEVPSLDKFYDLRLNPVNICANLRYDSGIDGKLKGCVFCHRCYGEPRKAENRRIISPKEIFKEIFNLYGNDVLSKVTKVLLNTGDNKSEDELLALIDQIYYEHLIPNNFRGTFSVVTTLIRSESEIKRLSKIDNTLFEFPIECFSRRKQILGEKKGIPVSEILHIFSIAKKYFKYIRINYVIGLDSLKVMEKEFSRLSQSNLINDVLE